MSQFLDWCIGEGELRANPWEALKVKDRPEGIRRSPHDFVCEPWASRSSAARNFGVRQTQASLLMFLDDDDFLVEDYCLRVINRIQSLPDDCTFGFSASL
jgi:hypothetical protein